MLAQLLITGIEESDKTGAPIRYRFIEASDPVEDITDMLHESYGPLAARGMRFVASHQDSAETRRRIAKGSTIVALGNEGRVVGIVTLAETSTTRGCAFYDRDDVASFGQFAVRPSHQGRGIGSKLLNLVETLAREQGVGELALDTSEHATELIAMYQAKGFRFVEYAQWKSVNYRSMVFSKTLC
jgi:GNAT superfamily N-acetyltransferase